MSYVTVSSHRTMALDAVRNDAYARALQEVIRPESVVLDLGAGTGVLGLMAAKLGARRVYLVEPEDVIALAEENVRANGLQAVVHCLHGRIEDVQIPEQVDVITSVVTGNFLVSEDLLPALFFARDRYLRPGGVLIPDAATMEVTPVSAPSLHEKEIAVWSTPHHGLDLSAARAYAASSVLFRLQGLDKAHDLAEPTAVHHLDFTRDHYDAVNADVRVPIARGGLCHGWVGWFNMKLADRWLSTSHRAPAMHWAQAFLPLDPPMALEQGEDVRFHLARAPHGDWVWGMKARAGSQRHSTLLSVPMKAATVQKAALDYQPRLTDEGLAVAYVLSRCDGGATMREIAESLLARDPRRYLNLGEALSFVQTVVRRHA